MPLKLAAYDPDGDLRKRAAHAVDLFTKEYNAVEDPGVDLPDHVSKYKANRKRWLRKMRGI